MAKSEKTRALIIQKTASVFNKQGFHGTSLSDIERATGLTKGSIYHNFVDKDEVALAVFDHNLKTINGLIESKMRNCRSAKEQLLVYVDVYSGDISKLPFPAGGCPMLNTAIEADDTHPELRKKASAAIQTWIARIAGIIEKGIASKEFSSTEKPEQVGLTIVAMIEGGIMISKVSGQSGYLRIVMKSVENYINRTIH